MNINNQFYNSLGDAWLTAVDHPIALLRAENRIRNPWIATQLKPQSTVLDIGCGAGFLTNYLAKQNHHVTGVDLSPSSLEIAQKNDQTNRVIYRHCAAEILPFPDCSFDAVCAMDLLEHVENPKQVIQEASRVLKPNGRFFFHTFNRNWLSWLIIIKGVDWCVANAPKNMHIYPLFIKPSELILYCKQNRLNVQTLCGLRPKFLSRYFWQMICTRTVPDQLRFVFTKSLTTGYCGYAVKN